MKTLLFFLGAACGIIYMGLTTEPFEPVLTPNKEACFILEMVENDSIAQRYLLDYGYREQVRHELKTLTNKNKYNERN